MSQNGIDVSNASKFMNVRDLVRMDLAFHGARFILSEFALAALLSVALGFLEIYLGYANHSLSQAIAGCFFLSCALNTLTFLFLAISITRRKDGAQKTAYGHRQIAIYTMMAVVLLLVPLIFPITAAYQSRK